MDATEGVEHIAAGLILSVIEQLYRNFGWIGHVCGAKEVIHAVQQEVHLPGSDAAVILGWVYYFDVLARFSFRHWRTDMIRATAQGLGFKAANTQCLIQYLIARTSFTTKVPTMSAHAHPLIPLLAEVLDTRLYSSDPNYHTTQYQEYLNDLSSRLSNVRIAPQDNGQYGNTCKSLELTRLASLVYHERVSRNFSGQSTRLSAWTKHARLILVSLDIFPPPFSLFVLGCEAHTDQHRMLFLDLFTRLERGPHLNSLPDVKGMIQTAWIQKDLEVDGELEYIHMINLVLSSRNAIPSFM
ncbi:hypothetical protein EJ02DRAFT_439975 [Clathrospora elynae]|uniref:Transcription factor domain-containing protein n=1 Tax=Clathrospora elynae TaxID=706981 RepID=A0A6A5TAK4_9PLEO|nr:hypothetical protein EJ02DRAFT_439975 [Clathrospora elynae]